MSLFPGVRAAVGARTGGAQGGTARAVLSPGMIEVVKRSTAVY